ncbi:ExbD/TolR family protein [Polycyclovorans algicola]|uniref:ExbD/TolR family protein n=1 Tax=Polycyclovorans algicola TaxID=616992 RepID=UPI0004A6ED41|nr:biopolymer transporter ExbD [Polycyclovorans algicola]
MSKKRLRTEEDAAIDLTPMLDVVFIMLIFFIVTTSFVKEAGVDVNRPSADTATRQEQGSIMIALRANGEVWMDRRQVDLRAVRAYIERQRVESPEASVVILADTGAETGLLVEVMDQVRLGGIAQISIAATEGGGG